MNRMRIARFAALAATATLLAGCTARHFHDVQTDFERALELESVCREPGNAARGLECAAGQQSRYAGIADEAGKLAKDARDPATRVGLYRLEGVSAWQAGRYDQARGAADLAKPLCDNRDTKAGPRDCAVLAVLPGLMDFDRYAREWAAMTTGPAAGGADFATRATRMEQQYRSELWPRFNASADAAQKTAGLPESFGTYLNRQRELSFCTYRQVYQAVARQLPGMSPVFDTSKFCPDSAAGLADSARMKEMFDGLQRTGLKLSPEGHLLRCRANLIELEIRNRYIRDFDSDKVCSQAQGAPPAR